MDEDAPNRPRAIHAATIRQEVSGLGTARDFERLWAEMATNEDFGLLKEDLRLLKENVRELRAEMNRRFRRGTAGHRRGSGWTPATMSVESN
jgi:hypothetical protein